MSRSVRVALSNGIDAVQRRRVDVDHRADAIAVCANRPGGVETHNVIVCPLARGDFRECRDLIGRSGSWLGTQDKPRERMRHGGAEGRSRMA